MQIRKANRIRVQLQLSSHLTRHPLYPVITETQWQYWLPALHGWVENGISYLISHSENLIVILNAPIEPFPCTDSGAFRWFGFDISPFVKVVPVEIDFPLMSKGKGDESQAETALVTADTDVLVEVVDLGQIQSGTDSAVETRIQTPVSQAENEESSAPTAVGHDPVGSFETAHSSTSHLHVEADSHLHVPVPSHRDARSTASNRGTDDDGSTSQQDPDIGNLVIDRSSAMGLQGFVAQQNRLNRVGARRQATGPAFPSAEGGEVIDLSSDDEQNDDGLSHRTRPSLSTASTSDHPTPACIRTDHLMTVLTCILQQTNKLYPNSSKSIFIALRRFIIPYLLQRSLRSIHLLMLGLTIPAEEYEALDMRTLEMVLHKLLITPTNANKQFNNIRGLFITNEDGMSWIGCQRVVKRLMLTWAAAAPWLFYLHEANPDEMAAPARPQHEARPPVPEIKLQVSGESSNSGTRRMYFGRRESFRQPCLEPKSASNFPERLHLHDRYQRIALVPVTLTSFSSYQHLIANSQQNVFFFVSSPSIQSRSVRLPHIQSMPFQAPPNDYFLCYMMNQLFNESLTVAFPRSQQEPILRFLEDVRPCVVGRDTRRSCKICRQQRDEWKSSFFGLSLMDCEKLFLHIYLRMIEHSHEIKEIEEDEFDDESRYSSEATIRPRFDHNCFWQQLRRIMHSKAVVSALSPQAVSAFHWMQPQKISLEIQSLVEKIHESCFQQNQWIQFIQVIEPSAEYVKANGRLQLSAKDLKPFLKSMQEKFLFNSHFHLSSPDQLLPHHPKHSAPYPHLMTNPFAVIRKKSLLLINNVESVTGFHKEVHISFGEGTTVSRGVNKSTGFDHSWRRALGAETGYTMHNRFGVVTGRTNSEAAVSGTSEGGNGNIGLGLTGLSVGAGVSKNWSTERSVGITNMKERAVEFVEVPHVAFNGNMGYDDSYKNSKSISKSTAISKDESVAARMVFEHPEALTKIIVGLKQHIGTISSVPKFKRKDRLILIFYQHPECYTELAVKRLGWNEEGMPPKSVAEGCDHHRSSAKQWMKCCKRWYSCHKCHLQQAESDACRSLNPSDISQIKCTACSTVQNIGEDHGHCSHASCEQPLSAYHCVQCRLWTHQPVKHCETCNRCVNQKFFDYHRRMCLGWTKNY